MKSIKLHEDTLSLIRALKTRTGGTYDQAITTLCEKHATVVEPMLDCVAQLDRIEILLLEIKDQLQPVAALKSKVGDTFIVE